MPQVAVGGGGIVPPRESEANLTLAPSGCASPIMPPFPPAVSMPSMRCCCASSLGRALRAVGAADAPLPLGAASELGESVSHREKLR